MGANRWDHLSPIGQAAAALVAEMLPGEPPEAFILAIECAAETGNVAELLPALRATLASIGQALAIGDFARVDAIVAEHRDDALLMYCWLAIARRNFRLEPPPPAPCPPA